MEEQRPYDAFDPFDSNEEADRVVFTGCLILFGLCLVFGV